MIISNIFAQDNTNKNAKPQPVQWQSDLNYSLKGPNGQLIIKLPEQASLNCIVNRPGETKTFALRNETPKELIPGNYEVTIWGIKIPVVIEKN